MSGESVGTIIRLPGPFRQCCRPPSCLDLLVGTVWECSACRRQHIVAIFGNPDRYWRRKWLRVRPQGGAS